METIDQPSRERFTRELDRNFSVIASAGSGKTRAITDRIVEIAQDRHALESLPKLVVVTYTNRAADEMQQRTRHRILEAGLPLEVIEAFNGTLRRECLSPTLFTSIEHAQTVLNTWRADYNNVRPHSSLEHLPPAHATSSAGARSARAR